MTLGVFDLLTVFLFTSGELLLAHHVHVRNLTEMRQLFLELSCWQVGRIRHLREQRSL